MAEPARDSAVTARIGFVRAMAEAAAVTPEAFDRKVLTGHLLRFADGCEAVLTQAARWDEESAALYARAEDFHDVRGVHLMVRAEATAEKAAELRDVIAASLLGKGDA